MGVERIGSFMCFLRFEGAGVLSSHPRGEHDGSGKKHGSAVPLDGFLEQGQALVTGVAWREGCAEEAREEGRRRRTNRTWSRCGEGGRPNVAERERSAAGEGRGGCALGVPLLVGEANERLVIRKPLPAHVFGHAVVVPWVKRRSRELVRNM
jgi:hypothetical protein